MWFITRARERYRTKSREERLYFREAGWQRMNYPIGVKECRRILHPV